MGKATINFATTFGFLTGNLPFPWQKSLYERFIAGDDFPESCDIPTGLGKTSVIAVWLIALAHQPDRVPRRLVYVVNRRTVVDQTTDEVEKYRNNLADHGELASLREKIGPLAISTLRGQFADNREWSANPSRPAVVVGTVDMVGSRLLFNGYGAGFRTRPLYAGLIGQDSLLVHDEAHLEPAFQELIEKIRDEQKRERASLGEQFRLKVLEMSATPRGKSETLTLDAADFEDATVTLRINAKKALHLIPSTDSKKLADEMAAFALERFASSGRAVLIFARKVEDVEKIVKKLPGEQVMPLTGTVRGFERDGMIRTPLFQRFLPPSNRDKQITPAEGTVYLVCTSAGEVGVNISANHLICDLSTFDSMTQRLGRVNRFGLLGDTEVHIFHPEKFDEKNDYEVRLSKSLELLRILNGNGSPNAIRQLDPDERLAAFAPKPTILPTSDILFDAWAMTTIRDKLPGRPKVEPYLHGIRDLEPPETRVAWREEVGEITGELLKSYSPEELDSLLDDYPLKPQELLRDRSDRVFKHLAELARKWPEHLVWLVDDEGHVDVMSLAALADKDAKNDINHRTVLLSPATGGLRDGMLDGGSNDASDVSDAELIDETGKNRRVRVWNENDERAVGMRLIRRIDFPANDQEDENAEGRSWHWFERPAGGDNDGSKSAPDAIRWDDHTNDVVNNVELFTNSLPLSAEMKLAIVTAARFHDLGKQREQWQRSIGNLNPTDWYAKSGKGWRSRDMTAYRHEFGSLLDLIEAKEFKSLAGNPELQELILHLVAAHHGYARPHFPEECAVDSPKKSTNAAADMARQVPQRFARLQRKYGRWGLAYLESLLRAADYEASARPTKSEGTR